MSESMDYDLLNEELDYDDTLLLDYDSEKILEDDMLPNSIENNPDKINESNEIHKKIKNDKIKITFDDDKIDGEVIQHNDSMKKMFEMSKTKIMNEKSKTISPIKKLTNPNNQIKVWDIPPKWMMCSDQSMNDVCNNDQVSFTFNNDMRLFNNCQSHRRTSQEDEHNQNHRNLFDNNDYHQSSSNIENRQEPIWFQSSSSNVDQYNNTDITTTVTPKENFELSKNVDDDGNIPSLMEIDPSQIKVANKKQLKFRDRPKKYNFTSRYDNTINPKSINFNKQPTRSILKKTQVNQNLDKAQSPDTTTIQMIDDEKYNSKLDEQKRQRDCVFEDKRQKQPPKAYTYDTLIYGELDLDHIDPNDLDKYHSMLIKRRDQLITKQNRSKKRLIFNNQMITMPSSRGANQISKNQLSNNNKFPKRKYLESQRFTNRNRQNYSRKTDSIVKSNQQNNRFSIQMINQIENDRSVFDNQQNNRCVFDNQQIDRRVFDNKQNDRIVFDNQLNKRNVFDNQQNNKSVFDSQQNDRRMFENQQNNRHFENIQNVNGQQINCQNQQQSINYVKNNEPINKFLNQPINNCLNQPINNYLNQPINNFLNQTNRNVQPINNHMINQQPIKHAQIEQMNNDYKIQCSNDSRQYEMNNFCIFQDQLTTISETTTVKNEQRAIEKFLQKRCVIELNNVNKIDERNDSVSSSQISLPKMNNLKKLLMVPNTNVVKLSNLLPAITTISKLYELAGKFGGHVDKIEFVKNSEVLIHFKNRKEAKQFYEFRRLKNINGESHIIAELVKI